MEAYKNLRQRNLVDVVFGTIKHDIISRKLKPGDRFPNQGALAAQFGVSRTVIREAQKKLASLGLLENCQGSGTYVCRPRADEIIGPMLSLLDLDSEGISELMEARFYVERTIVRLAAERADLVNVSKLKTLVEGMTGAAESHRLERFICADVDFHLELANLSGNRVLAKIVETIREMTYRFLQTFCLSPGAMHRAINFHQAITKAVEANDPDMAEEQMRLHLMDIVKNVELHFNINLNRNNITKTIKKHWYNNLSIESIKNDDHTDVGLQFVPNLMRGKE
jgi:DNA-binding FadR family transcriptional regulator